MSSDGKGGDVDSLFEQVHSTIDQIKDLFDASVRNQSAKISALKADIGHLRQQDEQEVVSLGLGSRYGSERRSETCPRDQRDSSQQRYVANLEKSTDRESCHEDFTERFPAASPRFPSEFTFTTSKTDDSFEVRDEWCQMKDETETENCRSLVVGTNSLAVKLHQSAAPVNARQAVFQAGSGSAMFASFSLESYRCVMHPSGALRLWWNVPCLMSIGYDMIMVPFQAFHYKDNAATVTLEWMATLIWTLDLILSFRTGYFEGARIEMRPMKIAKNYTKRWLLFDVLLVATEWFGQLYSMMAGTSIVRATRATRTFRILRCVRLLRLAKIGGFFNVIEEQINSNIVYVSLHIVKWMALLGLVIHIVSCTWYFIGDSLDTGWTSYAADKMSVSVADDDLVYWYSLSARWTFAQINGRTDQDERRNAYELFFTCAVAMLIAIVFMSIFISSITATMLELGALTAEQRRVQKIANEYLERTTASRSLIAKVKRHLGVNEIKVNSVENEKTLLQALPQQLQYDLLYEVRGHILMRCKLFKEINDEFPRAVRQICSHVLVPHVVAPEEAIFDEGDPCSRMLLLAKGHLIYKPQERILPSADDGESSIDVFHVTVIAEAGLWARHWLNQGRLYNALSSSFLLSAEVLPLANVTSQYKDAYKHIAMYARSFVDELRECKHVTDIIMVSRHECTASQANWEFPEFNTHSRVSITIGSLSNSVLTRLNSMSVMNEPRSRPRSSVESQIEIQDFHEGHYAVAQEASEFHVAI